MIAQPNFVLVFLVGASSFMVQEIQIVRNHAGGIHEYYNVDSQLLGKDVDPKSVLIETSGLGFPSHEEKDRITDIVLEFRASLLKQQVNQTATPFFFSIPGDDRTVLISFQEPCALTLDLVRDVQSILRHQAQNWRVIVEGSRQKNYVAICSNALSFEREGDSIQQLLSEIRREEIEWHETHTEVGKRQLVHVKQRIKAIDLPKGKFEPIVIAAYETYAGDF